MVVKQVDRLPDDPLEQGIVGGLGDGGVKGHILFGREHFARAGQKDGQPVQVFEGGPSGRQSGRLDLHGASDLHELDDALRPLPSSGAMGAAKLGVGRLATVVPWAPRPEIEQPWALSSRSASRTAGRPDAQS